MININPHTYVNSLSSWVRCIGCNSFGHITIERFPISSIIEGSVFGAEFVAMKTGVEALRGIRYKLRMMGVPLTVPNYVYGDNMYLIYNTSRPQSSLKKKRNSICYHAVHEVVASGQCLTMHCKTGDNYSDTTTKVLYGQ